MSVTRHPRLGLSCSRRAYTSAWFFSYSRFTRAHEKGSVNFVNIVSRFGSLTTCSRARGCAGTNYPFLTRKERDTETALDYFGARYFSSTQGRFTGADSAAIKRKHLINPQDLNRYTYVANNPLAFVDPDGEEKIKVIVRTFIPQKTVSMPHPN